MTTTNISKAQARANIRFETAKQIRALMDEAKKSYGPGWEDDDMEAGILELVTEE